ACGDRDAHVLRGPRPADYGRGRARDPQLLARPDRLERPEDDPAVHADGLGGPNTRRPLAAGAAALPCTRGTAARDAALPAGAPASLAARTARADRIADMARQP